MTGIVLGGLAGIAIAFVVGALMLAGGAALVGFAIEIMSGLFRR